MENMAILNTTALDFVEDYNRVDIWKKASVLSGLVYVWSCPFEK